MSDGHMYTCQFTTFRMSPKHFTQLTVLVLTRDHLLEARRSGNQDI